MTVGSVITLVSSWKIIQNTRVFSKPETEKILTIMLKKETKKMFYKIWQRITSKRMSNEKLTRKEQVLHELNRGAGTARQLADRMGLSLSIVRPNLSALHKDGLIRDTGTDAGLESVWEVVK